MSGLLAGLAGGFQGANRFVDQLMEERKRKEERDRQEKWRTEDMAYRTGRDSITDARSAEQFEWQKDQAAAQAEAQAKMRERQAYEKEVEWMRLGGSQAGINYQDPARAYKVRSMGQMPGSGTPDIMGALTGAMQRAGSGMDKLATQQINTATEQARRQNVQQLMTDTPYGQVAVENKQFRPYDPNSARGGSGDPRNNFSAQVTAIQNSIRLDRSQLASQVMMSIPEITTKYGNQLLSGDANVRAAAEQQALAEFAPLIESKIGPQVEMRRKAALAQLQGTYSGLVPDDVIYGAVYGAEMPKPAAPPAGNPFFPPNGGRNPLMPAPQGNPLINQQSTNPLIRR